MNDLETRTRSALRDDPEWRSADALLDGVRQGVRRRRRTRAVGAGAAVALALAGGALTWPRTGPATTPGFASHSATIDRHLRAVSVDASGTAYKVTGNQGCETPCSTIFRHDSGGWETLATIHGSADSRHYGPVLQFQMAPGGQDGWAWGSGLWSTHDGGKTWTEDTSLTLPTTSDLRGNVDVYPGRSVTWATVTPHGFFGAGTELWRTPTGRDQWTRVGLPEDRLAIAAVLPDSRVALLPMAGDLTAHYVVGDGTGPWQKVDVPCVSRKVPLQDLTRWNFWLCGPGGHPGNLGEVDDVTEFRAGVTDASERDPLGHVNRVFVDDDRSFLLTPDGAVAIDGPKLPRIEGAVRDVAVSGSHVALLAIDGSVSISDDDGHHWRTLD